MQKTKSKGRLVSIIIVIFILLAIAIYFFFITKSFDVMPDDDKIFSNENIIILDSLRLNANDIVYWFEYGGGVTGNSINYIAVGANPCSISQETALFESGAIMGMEKQNDTIKVSIYESNYKILNSNLKYTLSIDSVGPVSFNSRRGKLNIPIKQLCY